MEWPAYTPPTAPSASERFWSKVAKAGPNDCWLWGASVLPNGYGQFDHTTAHRFALMDRGVEVRADQVVDHLCRTLLCVNPAHLEAVTPSVNVVRGYGPNYAVARVRDESSKRTHCKHGHALTPENTYTAPSTPTWRVCRACRAARQRRRIRARIGG